MKKYVLFIQGGGEDGYEADKPLVASLQAALGSEYKVVYPELISDMSAADFGWSHQIGKNIADFSHEIILVGHSLGASMILKYLSGHTAAKEISGLFLVATPFWSGREDWKAGLKLHEHFEKKLPREVPIYFYQCRDDEEVPFGHLNEYKQRIPHAVFREFETGGHQFHSDLSIVAQDIQSL